MFVRRSTKVVVIGLDRENEYVTVDFCKERELESLLAQLSRKYDEKVKDLYLVSASNPEKELSIQRTLVDQKLVHEDVLLLKSRRKKRASVVSSTRHILSFC